MSHTAGPRDYQLTFGGAGEQRIEADGRSVRILEATADVWIRLDHGSELKRRAGQGINIERGGFKTVTVRSATAQTVRLVVSDVRQDDDQESVSVTVSATVEPGNDHTGHGDVSVSAGLGATLAAADANRLALMVVVDASQPGAVRVGPSGVTATGGVPVEPGGSAMIATTAAVHAFNPGGSAVTVNVLPVRKI